MGWEIALAAGALALAGQEPERTQGTPEAMARLVPEGCALFLQIPSSESLDVVTADLEWLGGAVDQVRSERWARLDQLGLPPELVDWERPHALALSLRPGAVEPDWTLIAALTDPESARAEIMSAADDPSGFRAVLLEDHVGLSNSPDYGARPVRAPLADLPVGAMGWAVDVQRWIEVYRPLLDTLLEQAWSIEIWRWAPIQDMWMSLVEDLLDDVRLLRCRFDPRDGGYQVEVRITLDPEGYLVGERASAERSASVADLARRLDASATFALAIGGDPAHAFGLEPLLDALVAVCVEDPETERPPWFADLGALVERRARGGVLALDMDGRDLERGRLSAWIDAADPSALASWLALRAGPSPATVLPRALADWLGAPAPETKSGEEVVPLSLFWAEREDGLALALCEDPARARTAVTLEAREEPALAGAVERLDGASPALLMRIDMRDVESEELGSLEDPCWMVLDFGRVEYELRLGLWIDARGLAALR